MSPDLKKLKELRERTNSGLLDCKNALEATDNDIEKAIKWLQENGIIKAAKKSARIAAEGITKAYIKDNVAVLFELNAETDFVARNQLFIDLANKIQDALAANDFSDIEAANKVKIDGMTIEESCQDLTAKIGEKITLRRAEKFVAKPGEVVAGYTHANSRVADIAIAKGANQEALRHVTMHIAALNPSHLFESCLPKAQHDEIVNRINSDPKLANKPEKIQESMKAGMLKKEFNELGVLMFQPFVMEDSKTVAKYLEENQLTLLDATRYEVGEGIEKKVVDFAAEVAEQMKQ
ncbi:Elongation factor Ts [Metamycoplasma arthritidis]|uniref:Elongation factor Ts n=1 Tax=Metamycoplasma arthritidis (strain 158L3-1) TaxID=243272 RepID=EFTS_META1|nr:translation elongation factor Ts [Metamycoplasma arthritidis]B3PLW7.1 RecName: Full=Elongation factor Ts; Short=EF-Ts [Metamycoplasma arthritidis 158L3-1]ACF07019.1 elongation factor Ts [Metamycoplasma arthritidis 158L3-1]VEU78547.1 Elongation factor Ts [Metamycoplasma arthritidis]